MPKGCASGGPIIAVIYSEALFDAFLLFLTEVLLRFLTGECYIGITFYRNCCIKSNKGN